MATTSIISSDSFGTFPSKSTLVSIVSFKLISAGSNYQTEHLVWPRIQHLNQILYIQAYQSLRDIPLDPLNLFVHVDLFDHVFHPCRPDRDDPVVLAYQAGLLYPIINIYY